MALFLQLVNSRIQTKIVLSLLLPAAQSCTSEPLILFERYSRYECLVQFTQYVNSLTSPGGM